MRVVLDGKLQSGWEKMSFAVAGTVLGRLCSA